MDNSFYIWGIPDVIFGGIVGAAIALLGTLIATFLHGWIQINLQKRQLNHDSKEKSKEREMALRRDVYLQAAEGIAKLQEYLKSYSSQSMSEVERAEITRNVWGTFNKVAIIGSIETVESFDRIILRYSELNVPILLKHSQLFQSKLEIEEINKKRNQLVAELEQHWKVLNSGAVARDSDDLAELEQEIEAIQVSIQTLFDEIRRKRRVEHELLFEISKDIELAIIEIERLMAGVIIAIRDELNLQTDKHRYLASVERTYGLMQESTQNAIDGFRKQITDLFESFEK